MERISGAQTCFTYVGKKPQSHYCQNTHKDTHTGCLVVLGRVGNLLYFFEIEKGRSDNTISARLEQSTRHTVRSRNIDTDTNAHRVREGRESWQCLIKKCTD